MGGWLLGHGSVGAEHPPSTSLASAGASLLSLAVLLPFVTVTGLVFCPCCGCCDLGAGCGGSEWIFLVFSVPGLRLGFVLEPALVAAGCLRCG